MSLIPEAPAARASLKATFMRGAAWSIGTRWSLKVLGLGSTLILARLLTPADYGLVVMAMLAVGVAETLTEFGAETNVLRQKAPTALDIDAGWTLRMLQGAVVAVILGVAAPVAGLFFDEPRVVPVIWVIALCVFISGFRNMGVIIARKEFNFWLEFKYNIICKLLTVGITLGSAYWLRDYRALVLGVCTGYLASVAVSRVMHPHRPRWQTHGLAATWNFSKWLFLSGIANYATRKIDEIMAARIGNSHDLGIYNVASEIGQLPTSELGPPIMRTFLPALSSIVDDAARLRDAVLQTMAAVNGLMIGLAAIVAAVAAPLTLTLLGAKWVDAIPLISIFALVGAAKVSVAPFDGLLVLVGNSKVYARVTYIELGVFALLAVLMVPGLGLTGLAYARLGSALVYLAVCVHAVISSTNIRLVEVVAMLWRPLAGGMFVLLVLGAMPTFSGVPALELALQSLAGGAMYLAWMFASWHLAGRPAGIERTTLGLLHRRGAA